MAVMLEFMKVPLSWRELLRRTFQEAFFHDNCLGMAAQLAYYFFFALFPALLFLVAIASYFPLHTLVDDMFRT
ncbi:MAG: YhjD/YihY/BrkB family envelope integrity protein, partial [Vicinamibacterales bacterium]